MTDSSYVVSFRDLLAYQKSRQLTQRIFVASSTFPKEETYSLTDQMRRASRSIGVQIAEAWAKRRYERHFVSKLTDADGELQETIHWIEVAVACQYIDQKHATNLIKNCEEIGRLLGDMISKSNQFCRNTTLREIQAEYFVNE